MEPSNPAAQARVRRQIEAILSDDSTTAHRICEFVRKCDESGFVADHKTEEAMSDLWDRAAELEEAFYFHWAFAHEQ